MLLDSKRTVDPRDNLDRAHRRELVEFARASGLDVDENMPADDIEGRPGTGLRNMLRAKGITRIAVPRRTIDNRVGDKTFPLQSKPAPAAPQATSDEWEEFQKFKAWKAGQQKPAAPATPPAQPSKAIDVMSINELRDACKARGIKMERRDNMASLKAKLNGQDAS